MTRERNHPWLGALLPLFMILYWQYLGGTGQLPRYLPPPSVITRQWTEMLLSGELLGHVGASLLRALSGFFIGSFLGIIVGLLAAALRPIERFYEPIISLTYPIPKIAALPIIFAWFGLGDLSKIIIISVSIFFPLYVTALAGAKSTSRVHIWAARNMGASPLRIIFRVLLPTALPQIFNGLRVGLALAFVVMFVAELVSSQNGLGYLIVFAEQNLRFDMVYVAIVTIGIIGFIGDRILLFAHDRLLFGQFASKDIGR
jgi:ABC-type nitrate/sulfonate/bicarbonate transport system permease component